MNSQAPSLAEMQHMIRRALVSAADDACAWMLSDGLSPQARLSIYRNTATVTLVNAIRLAFPAFERLVGAACFEGAARRFMAAALPSSAWLDEYGAAFPRFVAGLPEIASMPYLIDVARLEWQVNVVMHAADASPLDLASLSTLDDDALGALSLTQHPAVALLQCARPADAIWRAVLEQDNAALTAIDVDDGPVNLLVQFTGDGVDVLRLSSGEWRIANALVAGEPIRDALSRAPDIDGHVLLATLLARGCFAGFDQAPEDRPLSEGSTS